MIVITIIDVVKTSAWLILDLLKDPKSKKKQKITNHKQFYTISRSPRGCKCNIVTPITSQMVVIRPITIVDVVETYAWVFLGGF